MTKKILPKGDPIAMIVPPSEELTAPVQTNWGVVFSGLLAQVNWGLVLTAIIAATPPTIMALAAYNKSVEGMAQSKTNHDLIDGKMTELVEASKKVAKTEGKIEGKSDEQDAEAARKVKK